MACERRAVSRSSAAPPLSLYITRPLSSPSSGSERGRPSGPRPSHVGYYKGGVCSAQADPAVRGGAPALVGGQELSAAPRVAAA